MNCLVLISLKTLSAINWQNGIMLHSQARVIVLIILPEMQLIKKKSTVSLKFIYSIQVESALDSQALIRNHFAQKLLTNLQTHSTLSTHTMGFPLEVGICFCKAVSAVFPFHLEYPYLSLKKQHQHLILHHGEKLLGDRRVNGYL